MLNKIPSQVRLVLLVLASFVSLAVGVLFSYVSLSLSRVFVRKTPPQTPEAVISVSPEALNSSYNILLLGHGGLGHDGGNLSDVIMLANIDPVGKKVTFVSIPRDLWVEIPVRSDKVEWHKINAAYAIGLDDRNFPLKEPQYKGESGGQTLTKKIVSSVSGLSVDYFVAIDFERFKKLIDALDGVEVNVAKTFDDFLYPVKGLENETCGFDSAKIAELHQKYSGFDLEKQFTCRYEHIHYEKGNNHMSGETALKFVRSRHSNEYGGDFARSERQIAVLSGVKDKLLSLYAIKKIDEVFNQFANMVTTDLDLSKAKSLSLVLGNPKDYYVNFVSISTDNVLIATKSLDGQFILIPKEGEGVWTGVQNYIREKVYSR